MLSLFQEHLVSSLSSLLLEHIFIKSLMSKNVASFALFFVTNKEVSKNSLIGFIQLNTFFRNIKQIYFRYLPLFFETFFSIHVILFGNGPVYRTVVKIKPHLFESQSSM